MVEMKRFFLTLVTAFLASSGVFGAQPEMKKITFATLWYPQAQFAGYYVALEKGFYRNHGLDVTIVDAGPAMSAPDYLKSGKADFALMWLTQGISVAAEGVPLVNFGQFVHNSGMLLVARKASGITKPSELEGRKVGVWPGFEAQPRAFFRRHGVHVQEVPQTVSPNIFLRGGVDAISAMLYDEYHVLLMSGVEPDDLTVFRFSDSGLNFPEDGLYALSSTYRADPAAACAFARASVEGWRYVFAHEDEALAIVLRRRKAANVPAPRAHQKWMMGHLKELLESDKSAPGVLSREDFDATVAVMKETGVIRSAPSYDKFFSGCGKYD